MIHRASPKLVNPYLRQGLVVASTALMFTCASAQVLGQEGALTEGSPAAEAAGDADQLEDQPSDEEVDTPQEPVDPRILLREEEARRERIDRLSRAQPTIARESISLSLPNLPRHLQPASGLRLGRFVYSPRLTVGAQYTDNASSDSANPESDVILGANASMRADALLRRHALGVEASVGSGYALEGSENDFLDWQALMDGRYDLTRRSALNAEVSAGLLQESDRSAAAEGNEDITVSTLATGVGYTFDGRRWDFSLDALAERDDYSGDDTAERDVTVYSLSSQIVRQLSEEIAVFVSPEVSINEFDDVSSDGLDRDSAEATGVLGVDFQPRPRLSLTGSVGYSRTFFEDSSANDDESSVVGALAAGYIYDARTDFELSASRGIDVSTVDDSLTEISTQVGARATRLLVPGHTVVILANYLNNDFDNGGRTDHDITASLDYFYEFSRNLVFNVGYQYFTRFSDESEDEFDENQAFIAVSLAF